MNEVEILKPPGTEIIYVHDEPRDPNHGYPWHIIGSRSTRLLIPLELNDILVEAKQAENHHKDCDWNTVVVLLGWLEDHSDDIVALNALHQPDMEPQIVRKAIQRMIVLFNRLYQKHISPATVAGE